MFERFTQASRAVLVEAQDVALELGSGHIGPGHILYGCAEVRDETGGAPLRQAGITAGLVRGLLPRTQEQPAVQVDPEALRAIGIDYEGVRAAVEQTFGSGALESAPDRRDPSRRSRKPPFTSEAKRSLELTLRVVQELHHRRIAPGHLLLGLVRLDDDFVAEVLEQAGATVADLSATVLTRISAAA
jgi:ATP-dependent Clp protease ATP-binding subunit ClpA